MIESTKLNSRPISVISVAAEYGSTDRCAVEKLQQRILRGVDECTVGVLIDMGETVYIGSKFLSALLNAYKRAQDRQRMFALCAVNGAPAEVLAVTRLASLWPVYGTTVDAIDVMTSTWSSKWYLRRTSVSRLEFEDRISDVPANEVEAGPKGATASGSATVRARSNWFDYQ